MPTLTDRKLTVLRQIAAGRSYKQIAAALGISDRTVRAHVLEIASVLPASDLPPKDHVLLYCNRILESA